MKIRKLSETEQTFSPPKAEKKSRSEMRGGDGWNVRAFTEDVTVDHIPAGCLCTWNVIDSQWRLKFRHKMCLGRHK